MRQRRTKEKRAIVERLDSVLLKASAEGVLPEDGVAGARSDQYWFKEAIEQLDAIESQAQRERDALNSPPIGDQAARKRERRRRNRIERFPQLLDNCIQQAQLARSAL